MKTKKSFLTDTKVIKVGKENNNLSRGQNIMNIFTEIKVLDDFYVSNLCETLPDKFIGLVADFVNEMPDKIEQLKRENKAECLVSIDEINLSIKEAAASIGARYLVSACYLLEINLRDKSITDFTKYVNEIESVMLITIGELKKRHLYNDVINNVGNLMKI